MKIELVHPFWKNYSSVKTLYGGKSKTIGGWISRVKRTAEKIEKDPSSVKFFSKETEPVKIANDFRGSAFEGFIELFLKLHGMNPLIGVSDYEPISALGDDYGVDGKGIGMNGKLITVQAKWRGEWDTILYGNKDHLHNFVNASLEMGVDIEDNHNMLILTTANEVFYKDMMVEWREKVRFIAPNQSWGCFRGMKYAPQDPTNVFSFKSLVDDNIPFWNKALELIS